MGAGGGGGGSCFWQWWTRRLAMVAPGRTPSAVVAAAMTISQTHNHQSKIRFVPTCTRGK